MMKNNNTLNDMMVPKNFKRLLAGLLFIF